MKCSIYTRASTDEQETSIINQQAYFKDYIERHNLELYDIYTDEAFSGTETSKRLSFQRLLEDGKNKKYDVLLAKSYSRFGRNQRETLTALAELFENGIRIIFVEDGLDSLRDKGQFGLFAWLAEQEARKISERIKMTWQIYNKEGKVHNTRETFGYNYNPAIKNFVVNEKEAKTVRLIFEMYLNGDSLKTIAVYLNKNGYPTKNHGRWYPTMIKTLVVNPFYLGTLTLGKYRKIDVTIKKSENVNKKDWFIHENNHEAIIPEDIFQKVQEEFQKRSEYATQNIRLKHSARYLFSNLIKCKLCGVSCVAERTKVAKRMSYVCREYRHFGVGCGHKRNGIMEYILLASVKEQLQLLEKDDFKAVRDFYKHDKETKRHDTSKLDVSTLDKQLEEQKRLGNSLLALFTEGIIGKEQFKIQNDSIAEELTKLTAQREELLREQNKIVVHVDNEGEQIEAITELLEKDVSEWTNEMLKKVIAQINLDMSKNEIEIIFCFSNSSN